MGRRAIVEGAVHAAKTLLDRLLAVAGDLEGLDHRFRPMVADAAGSKFIPVAGDVVLKGLDRQRVLGLQRRQAALRHGERIVRKVDLLFVLVPFEHRKIDNPGEFEPVLFDKL